MAGQREAIPSVFDARGALVLCVVVCLIGTAAAGPPQDYQINLPQATVAEALNRLAEQTGVPVIFPYDLAKSRDANPVVGRYTLLEALAELLEGTGLSGGLSDKGVLMISVAESEAPDDRGKAVKQTEQNPKETKRKTSFLAGVAAFFASVIAAPNATGQETEDTGARSAALEEIIVTAEKRSERIQDMPIAISAFSDESLKERGIEGIEDLQQLAPSFQMTVQPGFNLRLSMRGIGNQNAVSEMPVSVNRDGVAYTVQNLVPGDFFDVDRVEILRGPQGTISGRNATAGAMHVHSNRPTEEFEGHLKATYGNYDRLELEGVLSGPIVDDRLLGRLAVRTDRADGWVRNTLRDEELGTVDKTQIRASFLGRLTDDFEALLILEGFRDRSNPLSFTYVDDGRVRPDSPTLTEVFGVPGFDPDRNEVQFSDPYDFDTEQYSATLRLNWQLGPSVQLTAITGYVDQEKSFTYDGDGTAEPFVSFDNIAVPVEHMSQEVTLTADLTDRLDVIAGMLYIDSEEKLSAALRLPPFALSIGDQQVRKLTSWAGYTQWRYRMTDEVQLTAGVRYTHDSKGLVQDVSVNGVLVNSIDTEASWNAWTPRFAVDYTPSDDLTLYASISRGFASGHLFGAGVDPEYVWNYEAGIKADWLSRRLRTNLTGFYMDYSDLQQALGVFDPVQNIVVSRFINAESATVAGVEWEFDALITEQVRFSFLGTWLDAKYDELRDPDPLFPELGAPLPEAPVGPNFRDLSGNRLIFSSKWKFNVSGEYRIPLSDLGFLGRNLEGVLRASYSWQDRAFYNIYNHEAASQGAYGLLNLFSAIETADGHWQLSAFVNNLTDKHYYTAKSAEAADALIPAARSGAFIGLPRQYGISLAYRF